jgi:hypothetical protein
MFFSPDVEGKVWIFPLPLCAKCDAKKDTLKKQSDNEILAEVTAIMAKPTVPKSVREFLRDNLRIVDHDVK